MKLAIAIFLQLWLSQFIAPHNARKKRSAKVFWVHSCGVDVHRNGGNNAIEALLKIGISSIDIYIDLKILDL